jgi:CBS-domain-containing membrane protein
MKARDVMVSPVITVKPHSTVKDLANLLIEKHISAVPVVDNDGKLVGVVSEGDLMHRAETGTEQRPSWWLRLLVGENALASDYIKSHTQKVADIMKRNVITVAPETPLNEIAVLMEQNAIKRVPIVQKDQLVGIVTRANLVQAIATEPPRLDVPLSDSTIRDKLLEHLKTQPWAHTGLLTVTVKDGIVSLWGIAGSPTERKAICVAAEAMPGVLAVRDNMAPRPGVTEA